MKAPATSAGRFWLPVSILLLIRTALGIATACQLGITYDEYNHLPVGLLNLRTREFDFDTLNPPLCRMLAALPLLATQAKTGPPGLPRMTTDWSDVFVAANEDHYETYFALGRSMIVLLSAGAALVTAIWARECFGNAAGCLAAFLWACEPTLLAHGSLVTTDLGATAFFVFTLYAVWKFAQRPTWKRALVVGLLLGLAQLTKFTCLLLYPLCLAAFVIDRRASARGEPWTDEPRPGRPDALPAGPTKLKLAGLWTAALALSVLVLNAGYLFRGSFSPASAYAFESQSLRKVANVIPARLPIPLPREYVDGVDRQRHVMEGKHPVFLDGQWTVSGFPGYYLWSILYKLPHPLQILFVATTIWMLSASAFPRRIWTQLSLLLPLATIVVLAQLSPMQLGIRYILPAIPFAILFIAQSAQGLSWNSGPNAEKSPRRRTAIVAALACWMLLSVRYHPHHLAYFNELAGGPLGGRDHLLDSNLDWGQDLQGLKRYLDAHHLGEIGVAYFGGIRPERIGLAHRSVPAHMPQPGIYAVSVSFSAGRPLLIYRQNGDVDFDFYAFSYFSFGEFRPIARIGYSIEIFKLTQADVEKWRAAFIETMKTP